jgi:uncharacterized protein
MTDQKIATTESKVEAARPPLPPFTKETAIQKVRLVEDGWNTRDPQKVALAYTIDSPGEIALSFRTAGKK